jgi:biopolymer transport protein ExbD
MNLRPHRKQPPDVNLTPLIDVVFLLLIFFMVSTTFERESQIKVQLPEAAAQEAVEQEEEILDITIDVEGRFYVNQREVVNTDVDTLKRAIAKEIGDKQDLPVVITADANASYQAVIRAMDASSQLGLNQISFPISESTEDQ